MNGMKGQLLEELGGASVEQMLGSAAGRAKLAGEFAGEELVFIPGYKLRDAQGRQLTDGLVGFWKGDTFQIVRIVESKAGLWAAEGLRLGEAEMGAARSARHRLMIAAYKRGDRAGAQAIREMNFADFMKAHRVEYEQALKLAESDGDWPREALEDVRARFETELRASRQVDEANRVANMSSSQFKAAYPDKAAEAEALLPLPEAGQFTRDLERTDQIGGSILQTGELPKIVEDGKISDAWKQGTVPDRSRQANTVRRWTGQCQSPRFCAHRC